MQKIALLADIAQPLRPDTLHAPTLFAYELAETLHRSAQETGGLAIDLVARKHSVTSLPLVSIDADAGAADNPLLHYAFQDSVYLQLVLSGAFDEYALVHCLAPIVSPLVLLSMKGIPVVQTLLTDDGHPSALLPPQWLGKGLRQVRIAPYELTDARASIPPSTDLYRYCPGTESGGYVLWLGRENEAGESVARAVADALRQPLALFDEMQAQAQLQGASVVLHLDAGKPYDALWLMRALACGVPFAAWQSTEIEPFFTRAGLGAFAPEGEVEELVKNIKGLPFGAEASAMRREYALAMCGRRSAAARYREVYKSILSPKD